MLRVAMKLQAGNFCNELTLCAKWGSDDYVVSSEAGQKNRVSAKWRDFKKISAM
jgi:hypothetical protein